MSDFENAALSVFLCLLSRSILSFGIDLRMKISLVHINMERAQLIDSIKQTKFHFRKNLFHFDQNETCEMTMDEIINGSVRINANNSFSIDSLFDLERFYWFKKFS